MQSKFNNRLLRIVIVIACIAAVSIFPSRTKQAINGKVRTITIPLGLKIAEFISRDFHYRLISREITQNEETDTEKVLAVFDWVSRHIHDDYPRDWQIVDDHILNIIIRGYGSADQHADVFALLCTYAGITAFWDKVTGKDDSRPIILSFVKLGNSWKVFDMYHHLYFKNSGGDIASLRDIRLDKGVVTNAGEHLSDNAVPYRGYLLSLNPVQRRTYMRAKRQMPLYRVAYEIMRLFRGEGMVEL